MSAYEKQSGDSASISAPTTGTESYYVFRFKQTTTSFHEIYFIDFRGETNTFDTTFVSDHSAHLDTHTKKCLPDVKSQHVQLVEKAVKTEDRETLWL